VFLPSDTSPAKPVTLKSWKPSNSFFRPKTRSPNPAQSTPGHRPALQGTGWRLDRIVLKQSKPEKIPLSHSLRFLLDSSWELDVFYAH